MEKNQSGFLRRFHRGKEPGKPAGSAAVPEASASWPKKAAVLSLRLSPRIGDCKARYVFKDLEAAFNSNAFEPGIPVTLQADGSVFIGGKPEGTFSNPKIQAMLRDWYELGDPVTAYLLQRRRAYLFFRRSRWKVPAAGQVPCRRFPLFGFFQNRIGALSVPVQVYALGAAAAEAVVRCPLRQPVGIRPGDHQQTAAGESAPLLGETNTRAAGSPSPIRR